MSPVSPRRPIATILFAALLAVSTAWAAAPETIRIITPEWEGQTNKDGTGLFFQIVREVYEPAGIRMKYLFAPWKRCQEAVKSREADAMLCVWKEHAEAMGQILPRYPFFVEYTAAVWKKGVMPDWKGIASLNGKRAVWLGGYDYHTLSHFSGISFSHRDEVNDYKLAWRMLDHDRVDVYVDALIDVKKYIAAHNLNMSPYRLEILWGENAYVAFGDTEKSRQLISVFDRNLKTLFESGRLKVIFDRWGATYDPSVWKRLI